MRFVVVCALVVAGCSDTSTSPTPPPGGAPFTAGLNTFDLTGSVRDSALRPVDGASVEISEGPLAGRMTWTDQSGRFAFTALTPRLDAVVLRISKHGYSPARVALRNHLDNVITLTSLELPNLQGDYRLTFMTANSCSQLPPALRARTYRATVRPADSRTGIIVALAGADVVPGYATFFGNVAHDAARLSIFSWDAFNWWLEDLPIIERLDGSTYVSFMGIASVPVGRPGTPIAGAFDGAVSYCSSARAPASPSFPPACAVAVHECRSTAHHISLTPW